MNTKYDIANLIYELIYHRYMLNKDMALFDELSLHEYIILHHFVKRKDGHTEKLYLSNLAEEMSLTIHQVSRMIFRLKERGFVIWKHDDNGAEGTYITVTDTGTGYLEKQEKKLYEYYEKIINTFGKEEMMRMLTEMSRFEQIAEKVCSKEGETDIE